VDACGSLGAIAKAAPLLHIYPTSYARLAGRSRLPASRRLRQAPTQARPTAPETSQIGSGTGGGTGSVVIASPMPLAFMPGPPPAYYISSWPPTCRTRGVPTDWFLQSAFAHRFKSKNGEAPVTAKDRPSWARPSPFPTCEERMRADLLRRPALEILVECIVRPQRSRRIYHTEQQKANNCLLVMPQLRAPGSCLYPSRDRKGAGLGTLQTPPLPYGRGSDRAGRT